MRVGLISLEPWDQVWRRNQHFATQLVEQGLASRVVFVEPPLLSAAAPTTRDVSPRVLAVRPALRVPKRAGGLLLAGTLLRSGPLRDVDVLWVNDATLGVHCLRPGLPAVYDVTDDWREFDFPDRVRRRLVRAEDRLAEQAHTVVCSEVLKHRWADRYGVDAAVVHNGVDSAAWRRATPRVPDGPGPHVGYVGTLHEERLDIELVLRVADQVGRLHLVGPDALGVDARRRLEAHGRIVLHGPVAAADVPSWTKGFDALISPHLVTPFTLSLDAIKSYEYLASGRPVVATPTSGFQVMRSPGLQVASGAEFLAALEHAVLRAGPQAAAPIGIDWSARAADFGHLLHSTAGVGRCRA